MCFVGAHLSKKDFLLACTPKQMPFLTISNENFFITQDTRLGAIVAPNKGLQWTLTTPSTNTVYRYCFSVSIVDFEHSEDLPPAMTVCL